MVREIDAAFLFAERIGKAVFFSRTEPRPVAQVAAHRRSEIAKAVFLEMKGQHPAVCIFRAKRPVEPIRAAVVLLGLEKIDHIVMLQIAVVRKGICTVGIIQKRHADAVDASDADGVPFACRRICADSVHTQSAAACKRVPNALFPSVHNMIVGKTKQIEARLFQRRDIAIGRVERISLEGIPERFPRNGRFEIADREIGIVKQRSRSFEEHVIVLTGSLRHGRAAHEVACKNNFRHTLFSSLKNPFSDLCGQDPSRRCMLLCGDRCRRAARLTDADAYRHRAEAGMCHMRA